MKDVAINPVHVKPLRIWWERFLYALMIGLATISLMVMLAVINRIYFDLPPVVVSSLDPDYPDPLCPGDPMHAYNHVSVTQPTVLTIYISVMDEMGERMLEGVMTTTYIRIHPNPVEFNQRLTWYVPPLQPGSYLRAVAIRGHDGTQKPIFVLTPFSVGENCDE